MEDFVLGQAVKIKLTHKVARVIGVSTYLPGHGTRQFFLEYMNKDGDYTAAWFMEGTLTAA